MTMHWVGGCTVLHYIYLQMLVKYRNPGYEKNMGYKISFARPAFRDRRFVITYKRTYISGYTDANPCQGNLRLLVSLLIRLVYTSHVGVGWEDFSSLYFVRLFKHRRQF
jgi:hypothetical protein